MTDLINLFKEKADEFLAAINQKGGVRATIEGLRRQMAEADRRRAMGRVKSELRRLDRQISEMITAVGVQAVALQEEGRLNSPELQPLCQHIIDLKATLSEQQAELAKLEASAGAQAAAQAAETPMAGATPCANCGRPVPAGGTFCPYCGAAVVMAARGPESVTGAPVTSPSAPSAATPSQPAAPPSAATTPGTATSPAPTPNAAPPPAAHATPNAAPEQPAPSTSRGAPASRAGAPPPAPDPGTMCANCGAPLKPGAKFCSKCGHAV